VLFYFYCLFILKFDVLGIHWKRGWLSCRAYLNKMPKRNFLHTKFDSRQGQDNSHRHHGSGAHPASFLVDGKDKAAEASM
jgi:hypothetical protein